MKVLRVIVSLFLVLLTACSSIRSNEEISLEPVAGRKRLVVNYDRGRYNTVKLDNVVIDSGRVYYVEKGEYLLSYIEEAFITGYIDFSWRGNGEESSNRERRIPTRKKIEILEDTELNLENHMLQINVSGTINSSKNF